MGAHVVAIGLEEPLLSLMEEARARLPRFDLHLFADAAEAFKAMRSGGIAADILIFGPKETAPISVAERAISRYHFQSVLVCTSEQSFAQVAAAIAQSVFLGDTTTAVMADSSEEVILLFSSALSRSIRNARHRKIATASEARLSSAPAPLQSRRSSHAEALWKYAPVGLLVVDTANRKILDRNTLATNMLGLAEEAGELDLAQLEACFPLSQRDSLRLWLLDPPETAAPVAVKITSPSGDSIHLEMLVAISGEDNRRLVIVQDVTTRALVEEELRNKLALIEEQKAQIELLSTPILRVWERVLLLPIVGFLDADRSARMMTAVLAEVSAENAEHVIIDLTGAPAVDDTAASGLSSLMQATRLLGGTCLLSGMSAELARSVVGLGVDIHSTRTFTSLYAALRFVLRSRTSASRR